MGPFLSLGLLSKDIWLDGERLRLVGSERRRPRVFSDFWLGSKIQTSAIPTLDASIHWDKSLVEKNLAMIAVISVSFFNLLHCLL